MSTAARQECEQESVIGIVTETILQGELLLDCRNQLGEGVRWHAEQQKLYWVDIQRAQLWAMKPEDQSTQTWDLPERIGSFAFRQAGDLLVALETGLHSFNLDNGAVKRLTHFEADLSSTRMNDGVCDRQGRFVVGGLDEQSLRPLSSVISYDSEGRVSTLISDVGCTNSLAFSSDGRSMYFADTSDRYIYRYDYDPVAGGLGDRTLYATLPPGGGRPDGSTVDAQDHLWNAEWGGARVTCYHPDAGVVVRVELPVSNITCCTFGGPDLTTLFITSARDGLSEKRLAAQPNAGSLFVCDLAAAGLNNSGLPDVPYAG
ncbi:SMP-30/gluconolactonase/LRE family protein [Pelagibius sp. Alg239-R121]|uniref:SMP-30/gluconolactonase/LRE family protein n=1 Tax=Pelagibius sp. Alg239-R121 TaxID=2993448 RepID=UPI0024A7555A|nr:SMP-30/gluconolactonase/LRE family protein [Pelagibius sp. Alg239-R121]